MPPPQLLLLAAAVALAGCAEARGRATAAHGRCSIGAPGEADRLGPAVFSETRFPAPHASDTGSLALTVVCAAADARGSEELVIVLPYLPGRLEPREYRVVDALEGAGSAPRERQARVAAYVARPGRTPTAYVARSGSVRIEHATARAVSGAYRLALTPEGPVLGHRLVLGGAFAAARSRP